MRIRMLEHSSESSLKNPESLNGMQKLNKIEHEAAALRSEMGHEMLAKEEQLAVLEQLIK